MAKNAAAVADKWARRLAQSTPDIEAGVQAVTVAPSERAIAAKSKMVQNFNQAMTDGKWERGLERVSLDDWKRSMLTKGISRIGQGAEEGKGKMEAYMREALPFMEELQRKIDAMPDLTLEDSIARMTTWIRGMSEFKRTR